VNHFFFGKSNLWQDSSTQIGGSSLPLSFASKNDGVHFSDVLPKVEYSRLAALHYWFFEPQITFLKNQM
jgi:hypothetical protein